MARFALVLLALMVASPVEAARPRTRKTATKPADAKAALVAVLGVERQSKAYYGAVLDKYRPLHPFGMVLRSERKHEQALLEELNRKGIAVPEDVKGTNAVAVPDDTARATAKAVEMEKKTVAAYDAALKVTTDAETRKTLERLRAESADHQRWFEDPSSCPMGGGRGRSGGGGRGR